MGWIVVQPAAAAYIGSGRKAGNFSGQWRFVRSGDQSKNGFQPGG
jgi:hypothetical protein